MHCQLPVLCSMAALRYSLSVVPVLKILYSRHMCYGFPALAINIGTQPKCIENNFQHRYRKSFQQSIMSKYSSDSDSDHSSRYRRRRNRKSRSSSSDTSDTSSPHRRRSTKHSKAKRRHRSHSRSRGRDRNPKSRKGYRSSHSRDRDKRRYHSSTGRSHSSDRTRKKGRSISKEKSQSPPSSSQSNQSKLNTERGQIAVTKDDFPIEPRFKEGVLEEINAEGFTPKQFISSASKENKFKNIVIDINSDTIQIPPVPSVSRSPESIFHTSIRMDQEARFDKWVKKLYTLRQKAIADLMHPSVI